MSALSDYDFRDAWSRLSLRRALGTLATLAGLIGVWVLASWLNTHRYHLLVGPIEVEAHRGVWLPLGHRPFVPENRELEPAYRPFPLPEGFAVARGEQTFPDRVQLDQALQQILYDAARYALEPARGDSKAARDPALAERYLEQLAHLPGLNERQRAGSRYLIRLLGYHKARAILEESQKELTAASAWLRKAALEPPVRTDAERLARRAERALEILEASSRSGRGTEATEGSRSTVDGPSGPEAEDERERSRSTTEGPSGPEAEDEGEGSRPTTEGPGAPEAEDAGAEPVQAEPGQSRPARGVSSSQEASPASESALGEGEAVTEQASRAASTGTATTTAETSSSPTGAGRLEGSVGE